MATEIPQPAHEFVIRIALGQKIRGHLFDGMRIEHAFQTQDLSSLVAPGR